MDERLTDQIACRERVLRGIKRILIEDLHLQLDADAIDPDVALFGTGLGLDSVDALELVVATESLFGVAFPQETLRGSLRTLNAVVDLVLELQALRGEAP